MTIRISFGVEDVIKIHDDIIENTGGAFGILNKGLIEFTIERVKGEGWSNKRRGYRPI